MIEALNHLKLMPPLPCFWNSTNDTLKSSFWGRQGDPVIIVLYPAQARYLVPPPAVIGNGSMGGCMCDHCFHARRAWGLR